MSSEPGVKDTTVSDAATDGGQEEEGRVGGRVIGGKATTDEIYLIDRAALEEGLARGPWIVKACVERAKMVLAAKSVIDSKPAA